MPVAFCNTLLLFEDNDMFNIEVYYVKKLFAEFFGTFWLVFGGCGSAIFAASVNLGIGYVGVAFAFGLTRINHGLRCRSHFWWSL